jgi:hypothetical protein
VIVVPFVVFPDVPNVVFPDVLVVSSATYRALALRRLMMVASASICCWIKLGDGWSGDGMLCDCG